MNVKLSLEEISEVLKERFSINGSCTLTWVYDKSGNIEGVGLSNDEYLANLPKMPQPVKAAKK